METGEDALGSAIWVKEVVGEDLGIDLIILVVAKDVLFVGAAVVDMVVGSRRELSEIVDTWHRIIIAKLRTL